MVAAVVAGMSATVQKLPPRGATNTPGYGSGTWPPLPGCVGAIRCCAIPREAGAGVEILALLADSALLVPDFSFAQTELTAKVGGNRGAAI